MPSTTKKNTDNRRPSGQTPKKKGEEKKAELHIAIYNSDGQDKTKEMSKKIARRMSKKELKAAAGQKKRPRRWALWLEGQESLIFQAEHREDKRGFFVPDPKNSRPDKSTKLQKIFECGKITSGMEKRAQEVIQQTPVHNEDSDWNCQEWVMDALARLKEEGILEISQNSMESLEDEKGGE